MSNWIKLKDKQPNVVDNNEKVLLYRIMNDSQKLQNITIYDTSMVKHCDENETWWQMLPPIPIEARNIEKPIPFERKEDCVGDNYCTNLMLSCEKCSDAFYDWKQQNDKNK